VNPEPILPGAEPFLFEGSDVGVLVSHGFSGSTQSMRFIGEQVARPRRLHGAEAVPGGARRVARGDGAHHRAGLGGQHRRVVPPVNGEIILAGLGSADKTLQCLHDSYHVAMLDYDKERLVARTLAFIEQLR